MLTLCVTTAWGQSNKQQPHIGYLYPAGGQRGSVAQITAGGQFLRGATDVYVSGKGVHASVIEYIRPTGNINKEQRDLLQKRLNELREKQLAELPGKDSSPPMPTEENLAEKHSQISKPSKKEDNSNKEDAVNTEEVKLPDHPLLYDLENKSLRELAHITNTLFFPRNKKQINRQISESVLIQISIDPDAQPGARELRIKTGTGLTNPMVFHVGLFPETRELEPNDQQAYPKLPRTQSLPEGKPIELPVVLNGQIMPGDVDRFRFRASQGQELVIETHARSLIPYLADAVPGWFQATLALYDANGNELAFADDYRFNPDPVLFYRIPADGEYELGIHDSIYRGREDFVYRIIVGQQPFITQMFPLGGKAGDQTTALVSGWNLRETRLPLDTRPGDNCIRQIAYRKGKRLSNTVPYAVDNLPECNEKEANDTPKTAQQIEIPKIINGRIGQAGDVDIFHLTGNTDDVVVAEVYARRLNSPLDSLLRLTDAAGNVLEWNDDYVMEDSHLYRDIVGLITHHADSYLTARLPKDGTYYVHLADSQHHGGMAYNYRLRIAAPQPDFTLRVTPSSISMQAGTTVALCVHALRKDGFDGRIEVVLKDAPAGFELGGGWIPVGRDHVRMTLSAPNETPDQPVALQLEGIAPIGGQIVSHLAVPSEDMMQAFLYRHLVPSQELLVVVNKSKWRVPPIRLAGRDIVRIPAGGTAQVRLKTAKRPALQEMQLELNEPPRGLTLHDVTVVPEGIAFRLEADKDALPIDFADNLIVEAFRESTPKQKNGKPANQKQRTSMGIFPAIPIEIVP